MARTHNPQGVLTGADTETYPFAPGRQAPQIVCGSFWGASEASQAVLAAQDGLDRFEALLGDSDSVLAMLNAPYDLAVLCAADFQRFWPLVVRALEEGRIHDVGTWDKLSMVAENSLRWDSVLGEPPRFSLVACERRWLGRDRSADKGEDAWRARYHELDGVPVSQWPWEAVRYALEDAEGPYLIATAQRKARPEGWPLYQEAVRHAFALHLMRCRGIRTDGAAIDALEARLREAVDHATPRLLEAGILRPNGTQDTLATKRLVWEALDGAVGLTATGQRLQAEREASQQELTEAERLRYTSADEDTLEQCAAKDPNGPLALWLEAKKDRKELADFVPKLRLGQQWPIAARWNDVVATFRTSCAAPNLQQQPRRSGVRETFVPRPGFWLCSVDYDVAELCSLAQVLLDLFEDSAMARSLQQGRKLHLWVAAQLAGCSYEEAVARHKAGDKRIKELRQLAKVANFGIPGGLAKTTLVQFARGYGVTLTEEEAQSLKERWLDTFPEMRRYFSLIGEWSASGRFQYTHPRTGFIRGDVGFCDGANTGFQHLTAAGAKDALWAATREAYGDPSSPLWGSYPVVFVHDEIIAEVPIQRAHEAAERLAEVMRQEMARYLPDIPVGAQPALMTRWLKDAEPTYGADGRLVPWG